MLWATYDDSVQVTAVALDKDRNTQHALKWAVDNLADDNTIILLVHVRIQNHGPESEQIKPKTDFELKQLFIPYRGFCARKGVPLKEVVLEGTDVSESLIDFINNQCVNNMVVSAPTRSIFSRKFKKPDVATSLSRSAPDFCSLYVISNGKARSIHGAKQSPPSRKQKQPSSLIPDIINCSGPRGLESDSSTGISPMSKTNSTASMETHSRSSSLFTPKEFNKILQVKDLLGSSIGCQSCGKTTDSHEFSVSSGSPRNSSEPHSPVADEMKRLKLELEQIKNMHSLACAESDSSKGKVQALKRGEAKSFKETMLIEEEAVGPAKMAEDKCNTKASNEDYPITKVAELHLKKARDAELTAQLELEERKKILNAMKHSNIHYRRYSIEEIKEATEDFSDSLRVGEGGYGPVYRGTLDHTQVAIKILRPDAIHGMKQFQQEVEVLSSIRHPNMVLLLGACPEYGCLVYEYMENGSLEDRICRRENSPPIPWWLRLKIAFEIAIGLLFLHQTKPEPIVHRDLKPANVLLDYNYVSKISDVGLARLVPASVSDSITKYHMTSAAGTLFYIDPEYQQTGLLGTKSDIYSLGIVFLQIITARPAMGLSHLVDGAIENGTFTDVLDPTISDCPIEEAQSFAKLALRCAELRKKDRPNLTTEILPELKRLRNLGSRSPSSSGSCISSGPNSCSSNPSSTSSKSGERLSSSTSGEAGATQQ